MLGVFDLFDMKTISSLHCNIHGEMNCTNLQLLGVTTVKRPITQQSDASTQEMSDIHYAILDYFPSENVSYFFTFIISSDKEPRISMDHNDPMYINTNSPKCTKGMQRARAI